MFCNGFVSGDMVLPTCVWIPRYNNHDLNQRDGVRFNSFAATPEMAGPTAELSLMMMMMMMEMNE